MASEGIRDVASSLIRAGVDDASLPGTKTRSQVGEQASFAETCGRYYMKEARSTAARVVPGLAEHARTPLSTDEIDHYPT